MADVNFITSMVAHRVIDTQVESKSNAIEESKCTEESKSTEESKQNEVKANESEKKDKTEVKATESKEDVNFISSMVSHRVVDPAAMVVPSQKETVAYSATVWEV